MLELEPDAEGTEHLPTDGPGEIRFENVGFSYDNRIILNGFNGHFSRGINILIGDLSATKDEVMLAAQKAGLNNLIGTLPGGYETCVGESGHNLSSGEMQKIALARVLLRDSPVIVFDEFTRSIDDESKRSIYTVIRQLTGKTVIIVTHNRADIEDGSTIVNMAKEV